MTDEENPNCIFPKCHECTKGFLVPFSFKEDVFEKWKCTKCGHIIRKND
tara:strand:- start:2220 stop:2366 length:147 start_codon:yes stop_codon:yes gene_type:complete